ncbi:phytanoyl-CoA dioxygenase family protein [Aspergillus stella-maris]|uniref:phytanoyl-CoA dioxygenase family protein n=1 Tax=Aspergillus stella-maris TaxID=1810926 RepID=UPI003CCD4277
MPATRDFGPMPEIHRIPASAGKEPIMKALWEAGVVIIKNFLPLDTIEAFNKEIDPILEKTPRGSEWEDPVIANVMGLQTRRLDNLVTHSKTFRHVIIENELLHAICTDVFGTDHTGALHENGAGQYWLNTTSIIDIGPGSKAQRLHRDQSQWGIFNIAGPDTPQANINFFFALSRFTEENGATRIRPGSHRWADQNDNTVDWTVCAEMETGDVCLFLGKTIHGGGANNSKDDFRRGMSIDFNASYLVPEDASTICVPRHIVEDMSPGLSTGFRNVADYLGLPKEKPVAGAQ